MAYTITKSDGTILATITDGTINSTASSLSLPGRNYSGYGQYQNINSVRQLENFASPNPPKYPLKGQLWFNTTDNTVRVCPADGTTTASSWLILASTSSNGSAQLGNIVVSGNITANNIVTGTVTGTTGTFNAVDVSGTLTAFSANLTNANVGNLTTANITTGSPTITGRLTGDWTVNRSLHIANTAGGNPHVSLDSTGVRADFYKVWNSSSGSYEQYIPYKNANVAEFLTTTTSGSRFSGSLIPHNIDASGNVTISGTLIVTGTTALTTLIAPTISGVGNISSTNAVFTTANITAINAISGNIDVINSDSITADTATIGTVTGDVIGNLTGVAPTAPTAPAGTNTTQIANTEFVQAVRQSLYPVGSIYFNAVNGTNPAILLGFGTWSVFGAGRVPVGIDTSNPLFNTAEKTGGSYDATVVSHTHTGVTGGHSADHTHSGSTAGAGSHQHFTTFGYSDQFDYFGNDVGAITGAGEGVVGNRVLPSGEAGLHNHSLSMGGASSNHSHAFTTSQTGTSATNTNIQPYITVYMWKRTA